MLVTVSKVVGNFCACNASIISSPHKSIISVLGLLSSNVAETANKTVFDIFAASKVAKTFPTGGTIMENLCLNLGNL